MAKKFTEYNGLNLTQVNNEVLKAWNDNDVFHKSIDEREGCPQFVFFEGPPLLTDIQVFTMSWHVQLKILSTDIRP